MNGRVVDAGIELRIADHRALAVDRVCLVIEKAAKRPEVDGLAIAVPHDCVTIAFDQSTIVPAHSLTGIVDRQRLALANREGARQRRQDRSACLGSSFPDDWLI